MCAYINILCLLTWMFLCSFVCGTCVTLLASAFICRALCRYVVHLCFAVLVESVEFRCVRKGGTKTSDLKADYDKMLCTFRKDRLVAFLVWGS